MSDIVDRLRAVVKRAWSWDYCYPGNLNIESLIVDLRKEAGEAADEIERLHKSADALTAAAARIAELEREASRAEIYRTLLEAAGYQNIDMIKDVMNAKALGAVVACRTIGLQNNLASATARAERLEAGLKHYVELFCEQPNEHSCGTFHDDFCLGCKGRAALPKG